MSIIFNRVWAMPNSNTFSIKPITQLIQKYLNPSEKSIDPFANSSKLASITNDMNPIEKKEAYQKDILYGTASEFGFDYLRDNGLASSKEYPKRITLSFRVEAFIP